MRLVRIYILFHKPVNKSRPKYVRIIVNGDVEIGGRISLVLLEMQE